MAIGVTLMRGTACARVRNENAQRSDLPIRGSGRGQAQKRREGESRDDLRHRMTPLLARDLDSPHVDHLPERLLVCCDDDHAMSVSPMSNSAPTDQKNR